MTRLVVATRSAHKLREIQEILAPLLDIELLDLGAAGVPPDPAEEGIEHFDTFEENARAKARYFAERSGLPVLADDSGLCVDALGGAPAVRSKRYSGRPDLSGTELDEANNDALLHALRDVPPARRGAHYVCCLALAASGADAFWEGRCDGVILTERRGDGGFGYDPLFFIPLEGATFGELPPQRKNELSHRADALRRAAPDLRRMFGSALT